jgi:hypothetical protein
MSGSSLDTSNSGFYDNGSIAAQLAEQVAFLGDAQQDMVGADVGVLVIYSRVDGVHRDVVQVSMDAKFDSQRRRQNREDAGHLETSF